MSEISKIINKDISNISKISEFDKSNLNTVSNISLTSSFNATYWDAASAGNDVVVTDLYQVFTPNRDACKTVLGVSSGKYYCEFLVVQVGYLIIGVCDPLTILEANVIASENMPTWDVWGNRIYSVSTADTTGISDVIADDIISMAMDFDNKQIEFFLNDVSVGIGAWATEETGHVVMGGRNSADTTIIANFGQSPFEFNVPSGFTPGFGV